MNKIVDTKEAPEKVHLPQKLTRNKRALVAVGAPLALVGSLLLAGVVWVGCVHGLELLGVSFEGINQSVASAIDAAMLYLLAIVILLGVPYAIWRKPFTSLKELGLDRLPSWQDILLAPASFVVYLLCTGILLAAATHFFPGFDVEQAQDVGFQGVSKRFEYLLAFTTLVVVAPIAEEVLLRGYLYGKLRSVIPMIPAMLITSVIFGVLHGQWNVALDTFALSMVMVSLREVTGSIWAGILLHMIKNGIAFYILFLNPSLLHMIGG